MAKIIQFSTPQQQNEARLVAGMQDAGRRTQYELYDYCADYFWNTHWGVFFVAEEDAAEEILQNSFITLWENIERRKVYAQDGLLMGCDGKPMSCNLLTYFMSIARNKYREWAREHPSLADPEEENAKKARKDGFDPQEYADRLYAESNNQMIDIISEVISSMSARCYEIITKFYYEEKNMDVILSEIPAITSRNALKTKKYKCMETLRSTAREMHHRRLNK